MFVAMGKDRMQRLRVVGIALWIVAGMASTPQAVVPGELAPDFTLQDLTGASYSLSGFAGEVVLLALVGYG